MAKSSLSTKHAPARHSNWGARLVKAKEAGLKAAKSARLRSANVEKKGKITGIVAAAALGYAEKNGYVPPSILGVNSSLVVGIGLGVVAPMLLKGATGKMLERAGDAALDIAAYKIAAGAPILGDDDSVGADGNFAW